MPFLRQGSIHLGRVAGINLYLHWSWFVVAVIEIGSRQGRYSSLVWSALEYLALFAIVMLIASATLLSLVAANRKAEALQSVMNNLNISLDEMVRNVRMGSNYRCNSQAEPVPPADGDCAGGGDRGCE